MGAEGGRGRIAPVLAVTLLASAGVLAGCGGSSGSSGSGPDSSPTSAISPLPAQDLTVGVLGSPAEVSAYRRMAARFHPLNRQVTVHVESWPDEASMMADFRSGGPVPDVFLAARRDISSLTLHQQIQPVDQLLDDRGVDFGDDYPRETLTGYSSNEHLLCLPYAVEPSVVFYNPRLLHLREIRNDPPTPGQGWSLDQFRAAASWATRHHPGVRGAYVDPSLPGLTPFLVSGGGQLLDDNGLPTTLELSSDASQHALVTSLGVLSDPSVMLAHDELGGVPAVRWFEGGDLAMLVGSRELVPELRRHPDLHFDVMPMPTLGSPATWGRQTGLCISSSASDPGTAADFLVYASSTPALSRVARVGYLQPANQAVALSNAFQQPGERPRHASVFTFSVKSLFYPPLIDRWDELETTVDPLVARLFTMSDPAAILRQSRLIDRASRPVLRPLATESPAPTPSQSEG